MSSTARVTPALPSEPAPEPAPTPIQAVPIHAVPVQAGPAVGAEPTTGAGRRRAWLQRRALPLAIGVNVGLAVASVPLARRLRRHLPEPLADGLVSSGLMVAGWIAVARLEHAAPFNPDWVSWTDADPEAAADRRYLGIVAPATASTARLGAMAILGLRHLKGGPHRTWSTRVPLPARVAGTLLVSELVHYWHHRLAHERPSLWPYHKVHHSGTQVYWINAARFHPVDEAPLLFLQTLALDLVGADRDALVVHNVLKIINGFVQHANLPGHCGPLNHVLSTAELHRLHHAARPGVGTNYGAVLSLWDRVFGTLEVPPDEPFDERVGLAGTSPYPVDVVGQMLEPLGWN